MKCNHDTTGHPRLEGITTTPLEAEKRLINQNQTCKIQKCALQNTVIQIQSQSKVKLSVVSGQIRFLLPQNLGTVVIVLHGVLYKAEAVDVTDEGMAIRS